MRIVVLATVILGGGLLFAADRTEPASDADHDLIKGRWKVVSSEEAGRAQQFGNGAHFLITADTFSIKPSQGDPLKLKYKLDTTQQPKAIDTFHAIDPGNPIVQRGIYSLEGDDLKLCIAGSGQPRPQKFDSNAGVLLKLRRAHQGRDDD